MRPVRGECKTQIMQQETAATYTISESIKRDAEYECRSFPNKQESLSGCKSVLNLLNPLLNIYPSVGSLRRSGTIVSTYGFAPLDENTQRSPIPCIWSTGKSSH